MMPSKTMTCLSMTTLEGIGKCDALQHHVYRKQYLSNQVRKHLCLKQCMILASKIELVRILRPMDEFKLDDLINRIKSDLIERGFTANTLIQ